MSQSALSPQSLSPGACRDPEILKRFIKNQIGVNAWPIQSAVLLRTIEREGLDQQRSLEFELSAQELTQLMRYVYRAACRVERLLGINNAFHHVLHNFEVFIRLLVLEWPIEVPMPEEIESAPLHVYRSFESVLPVALNVAAALQSQGVSGASVARAALAALGHDYGHTGGTDRTDANGLPLPLTHEETAEKHIALVGLKFGFPAALILESLAGIRATTFHHRPGRERVQPSNAFEMRITLADVMGCVLPPDQWLTHVGVPVLMEKIPSWKQRTIEIAFEEQDLQQQRLALHGDCSQLSEIAAHQKELDIEGASIIRDIGEWFQSERRFFVFIDGYKLEPVPGARKLWGKIIQQKIVLVEALLSELHLLKPLVDLDGDFLEKFARQLSNVPDLRRALDDPESDARLRELLLPFVTSAGH